MVDVDAAEDTVRQLSCTGKASVLLVKIGFRNSSKTNSQGRNTVQAGSSAQEAGSLAQASPLSAVRVRGPMKKWLLGSVF